MTAMPIASESLTGRVKMSFDLTKEPPIPLSQVSKVLKRKFQPSTIWRWCRDGIMTSTGQRVRLEHVRLGRGFFTSIARVQAFAEVLAQQTGDPEDESNAVRGKGPQPKKNPPLQSVAARRRSAASANRKLEAELAGV
jgi:hypothetical protein